MGNKESRREMRGRPRRRNMRIRRSRRALVTSRTCRIRKSSCLPTRLLTCGRVLYHTEREGGGKVVEKLFRARCRDEIELLVACSRAWPRELRRVSRRGRAAREKSCTTSWNRKFDSPSEWRAATYARQLRAPRENRTLNSEDGQGNDVGGGRAKGGRTRGNPVARYVVVIGVGECSSVSLLFLRLLRLVVVACCQVIPGECR